MSSDKNDHNLTISSVPERGWVTIQAEISADLENPIIELSVLSEEREPLASTVVMDAPVSFKVTLHPRDVKDGMSLFAQIKLIDASDKSVKLLGEYPFTFETSPNN